MAFTDADRGILVETHTLIKEHDRRLADLETEDDVLHKRINETNTRINSVTRWFTGLLLSMNTAWGGLLAYLKMRS